MNKKHTVSILQGAEFEILEAFTYYNSKHLNLGNRFIKQLDNAFESIQKTPKGFTKVNDFHQVPVAVFPFVIIYDIIDTKIIILAVFNTNRNPRKKIS